MRKVEIFIGHEIDKEKIKKMKSIAYKGFKNFRFKRAFKTWHNINSLEPPHFVDINNEVLVLGEDWFLLYNIEDYAIRISSWVAIDYPETKLAQSIEMMTVLKELLLKYQDRRFDAKLRHLTSYQIYKKMLDKGYFCEACHTVETLCAPNNIDLEFDFLYDTAPGNNELFEFYLSTDEGKKHPEYLEYIAHFIIFNVTPIFLEKYDTKEKKYIL